MNKLLFVFVIFSALFSASYADEDDEDVCCLPKKVGPCRAAIPRYYYDSEVGICKEFTYGGCEGNGNRFKTLDDCLDECGVHVCTLPKKVGPCKAHIKRYYYNEKEGKCEVFYYGGCLANGNNFETLNDCRARCDVCSLPKDQGPCLAALLRYYYNSVTKKCEKFTYGGCEGNENNFKTIDDCKDRCY